MYSAAAGTGRAGHGHSNEHSAAVADLYCHNSPCYTDLHARPNGFPNTSTYAYGYSLAGGDRSSAYT